jgi:DNA modification methylase
MVEMEITYQEFLASKRLIVGSSGIDVKDSSIHPKLFPFQRDLVRWSCKKGRSAIFADTGLGKTFMQLEWARLIAKKCLIVAPLSVARQTVREAEKIGLMVNYCRSQGQTTDDLNITNYEMIEAFDPSAFDAVVLDESSILKSIAGKTKAKMIEMFVDTPFKLCCTATPAPNDIAEIANHAEFLGIMSRVDMLATFFVHDDEGWRLKGHAEEPFYRWMASWGMSIRKPSDLGYDDDGYILPPLTITPVFVDTSVAPDGQLFFTGLKGITDRCAVRKATVDDRLALAASLVSDNPDQWLIWCGLNDEADGITKLVPDSINVKGSMSIEAKIRGIEGFQDGTTRILISKPKIAGHGLNLQNCHNMVFLGLSDSYEAYYQCIRRCYRFGQTEPVNVFIVLSEMERDIFRNVQEKEREARKMGDRLIKHVKQYEKAEIEELGMEFTYETDTVKHDEYTMMLGDSVERMKEIPDSSVGLSVFSPPFLSLYTYSPTERDVGNSREPSEFFDHFKFIIDDLLRVTKPGRLCCAHCAQVATSLNYHGYIGLQDFRGMLIAAFIEAGWVYHGEVCIDKDPQVQAIRSHAKGLLFVQMHKDSSWSRQALADYICVFRKPGENIDPIHPDIENDEWIEWARPIWYGIKETNVLNVVVARTDKDERHICPLQLGTIERCIRLWSNAGDTVLSPFAGIGSEGYQALKLGRRFIGIELKKAYYQTALNNLAMAIKDRDAGTLFEAAQEK